jgi:hypothetical protein
MLESGKIFDNYADGSGFLRLTTAERTARHIGNRLDDSILEDARLAGYDTELYRD